MSLRLLAAASILGVSLLGGAPVATAAPRADSPTPSPSASSSGSGTAATPNTAQRVTFGIGAATHNKLDGRSEIRVLAPLGGDYKDQVAVVNVSAQPLALKVYAANMRNDESGRLEADPAADKPTDLATWLRLATPTGTSTVVVPKKGMVFVPVTLHVPKNAAVGDHMAAIVVSLSSTGRSSGSTAPNVTLDQRVGLRLALRVAGPMNPHLTVANISASYSGTLNPFGKGKARVTYTVRNDGNLRLGGTQSVTIHGLFGTAAPNVKLPDVPVLLPGATANFTVDVPDVIPMGLLSATVVVTPAAPQGDADPPSDLAEGSARFWAISWTLLAVVLLLSALVAWWVRHRRRRPPASSGRREAGTQPELVATGVSQP